MTKSCEPSQLGHKDADFGPILNECNRLWALKKGCVKSEVSGCEYHSEEEFLAVLGTKLLPGAVAAALG
jgi:hypothetical protein